jgi:hypothetical protein
MRGFERIIKTYRCPDLRNQADVQDVQDGLSGAPGLDTAEVDWVAKTVTVRLDTPDAVEDVLMRLREAGFPPETEL